jgi:hypothetical protein
MNSEQKPFYTVRNRGFIPATTADELLHPAANAGITGDSLTETQYFGLCMPEERIHGVLYCWHRPNLGIVSGGVWVWQGMKPLALACEMYDWWDCMSDAVLADDLHAFKFENGYGVTVIEPLKKHRVFYQDAARGNRVDLEYEALAPPVVFGDGTHLEQGMRVTGDLQLAGKSYRVNAYNIRDRSWGKLRPEAHSRVPPVTWLTGIFNDDFFFNCTAFDHPDLDPTWKAIFPGFSADKVLIAGWIHKSGKVSEIIDCRKRTVYNRTTLIPETIEVTVRDSSGDTYNFNGQILAASTRAMWPNMNVALCMTRWECGGLAGHGDAQDIQSHDFVRAMYKVPGVG